MGIADGDHRLFKDEKSLTTEADSYPKMTSTRPIFQAYSPVEFVTLGFLKEVFSRTATQEPDVYYNVIIPMRPTDLEQGDKRNSKPLKNLTGQPICPMSILNWNWARPSEGIPVGRTKPARPTYGLLLGTYPISHLRFTHFEEL
ncbi:hypothetical protein QTO34_012845 [Cnephaeus nilssonii]|uniref:Uncharacterized protein n=1 Tax=Cnephaeus nilssonii TaxID=3371016 RepID=A0AA40HAI9_CNENI|nr:hypothetical protein QTO34_012845 [Eptesicus nilssonii]